MHGLSRVLISSSKLDRGITLFTGAKLIKLIGFPKNPYYVFSYQNGFADLIGLGYLPKEVLAQRIGDFERQTKLYSQILKFREAYDREESSRIDQGIHQNDYHPNYLGYSRESKDLPRWGMDLNISSTEEGEEESRTASDDQSD